MPSTAISITEMSSPLTSKIDVATPVEIVRMLRQCDAQVFTGWQGYASILDEESLEAAARVAWRMSRVLLAGEEGSVVLGGAGTSGRIALFLAREFNRQLRVMRTAECFRARIAGGERALVQPVEGAEDSAISGVEDLRESATEGVSQGLYIGISAGLSAPYISAQLAARLERPEWSAVLLGFNPIVQARPTRADERQTSMADVVAQWRGDDRFITLTPVYGPEAIAGSTRMKGGTCTKLLLETIFQVACEAAGLDGERPQLELGDEGSLLPLRHRLIECLLRYRAAFDAAYLDAPSLGAIIRMAGSVVRSGGRIHYLGRGTAGMIGMMDAAECLPTFGSDPGDVRGFIQEGWSSWTGEDEADAAHRDPEIDFGAFEREILPGIGKSDLVIGVAISTVGEQVRRLLDAVTAQRGRTALILASPIAPEVAEIPEGLDQYCRLDVPSLGFRPGYFNEAEVALKLALNAVTTGAHIVAGRVFGNMMIDLRMMNTKLYVRCIRIIQALTGIDEAAAKRALHGAVFETDSLSASQVAATPLEIVRRAGDRRGIVPRALLVATGKFSNVTAARALAEDPFVRRVVESAMKAAPSSEFRVPSI